MAILLILFGLCVAASANPVRVCVPETLSNSCAQMEQDLPDIFKCIIAPDTLGCLEKVHSGHADTTNVDPSGLYLAGKYYDLRPIVTELEEGEPFDDHQGIAVVRKDSDIHSVHDLQNRTSCHTGLERTVGWQIPVGKLISNNVMRPDCQNGDLASVSRFFSGSCVPGDWSSDPVVDRQLKSTYSNLCSRCKDTVTCAKDDAYYGYDGVMNCLSDGAADVAFTKVLALKKYLQKHPELTDRIELLCFEGGRKSVLDPEPCLWGVGPTNAFVAKAGEAEDIDRIVATLLGTQNRYSIRQARIPDWYHKTFLHHSESSGLIKTEEGRNNYLSYLGDFVHTIRKERHGCEGIEEGAATFCVTSDEELSRCEDYSRAVEGQGLWPDVRCVKSASKVACMEALKQDHAQLLVLDGGDVYKGGKYYGLQPVASELYNGSDATYYAVTVLRSASDVTKLSDLKGLRSCHTGMGRTAGWVMPVGALVTEGLLPAENCNHAESMANFFDGSCVPGANDTKYNPGRVRSEDLCRQCTGDDRGQNKCARDSKERYSGYAGALRCLAEARGDVAFVKHKTVPDYTDGHSKLPWTRDLLSSDFMLLCDVGGTASVFSANECNFGKVPSHQIVTGGAISPMRRLNIARLLSDSSKLFGDGSKYNLFRLFTPVQQPDLLFKDSTTALKIIPSDHTYEQVLGPRFLEASKRADPRVCTQ